SRRATVQAADPPELGRIGPDTITTGAPTFTVRAEGRAFVEGAVILFDGQPLATRFVSKKVVVADVDASVVAAPGTHTVAVRNPDGQTSASATLTVVDPTADFFIRLPQNAVQEGIAAILAPLVTGEGLDKVTKVLVGGKSATFEFINDRTLQVQVPTKFNDVPARVPFTAVDKQGHYSNTEILFIVARVPKLTSTDPIRFDVGSADQVIQVFGNFADDAQIVINGVALPTTTRKGHLEATIPASLLAQPGLLTLRIQQGGVQSEDVTLPVSPADDPFIFTVAPLRLRAGEDRATIDVIGDNFGDGTTALIDGQEAKIKGLSKRTLTVIITSELLSAPGTHTVQIKKGDKVTSSFTFEVVPDVNVGTLAGLSREGLNDDTCVTTATATFRRPRRVAIGPDGLLYITDQQNHVIRSLNPATGEVCIVAGTGAEGYKDSADSAAAPVFSYPNGVVVGADGTIYVSENGNNVIRRIVRSGGAVTVDTFAGDFRLIDSAEKQKKFNSTKEGLDGFRNGPLIGSAFRLPDDLVIASDGTIYVADAGNHAIRRIRNGVVETVAGNGVPGFADGVGENVRFNTPTAVALSLDEQTLYVADTNNNRVRQIELATARVSTLAGSGEAGLTDGPAGAATFNQPIGLAVDVDGTLYVSEVANHDIRRIDLQGNVTSLAGRGNPKFRDGAGASASFNSPRGLALDRARGILYVVDTENQRIRQIALR
ncbi:MAG TPA: SMP-30/gluconolactonase/LRE family protein, partial [Blastocatellia bacterium]|nr:SMP-30/gluconolactonase/LRE family protein [Blastocatellia bacterium]